MTHILLVDDDQHVLAALKRQLTEKGHRVTAVADLSGGVAELEAGGVDVLVTDHRLGPDCGLDLLRRAAELSPRIRSIVISGAIRPDERRKAYELGAVHVLDKPFSARELATILARCVAEPLEQATPTP